MGGGGGTVSEVGSAGKGDLGAIGDGDSSAGEGDLGATGDGDGGKGSGYEIFSVKFCKNGGGIEGLPGLSAGFEGDADVVDVLCSESATKDDVQMPTIEALSVRRSICAIRAALCDARRAVLCG